MTTILNIQTDEQVSRLMRWILSEEGYHVIDVRAPADMSARPMPDVIIVNTNMENNEKRTCIGALRALVPTARIIDLGIGAEQANYETGADGYLGKPFWGADLVARVRQATAGSSPVA